MRRHPENPIITPEMVKPSHPSYRVRGAFNPGAVLHEGEVLLLLRVAEDCVPEAGYRKVPVVQTIDGVSTPGVLEVREDDPDVRLKDSRGIVYHGRDYLSTMSHIRLARSRDGVHFTVDDAPFLFPSGESEVFGVEDARVVKLDNMYYINYTCVSEDGWATALASTRDFQSVTRHGIIFPPQNKDVAIFPRRIDGSYHALHRPHNSGFGRPSIWYSRSEDLIHWGGHSCLIRPRDTRWEEMKIGGGGPCIETEKGWLQIYHGKGHEEVYSLFLLLLDLDDPRKVLYRGTSPLLHPEVWYERKGFFGNVVFTNGSVETGDGRLLLYYGASDEYSCLLETSVDELLSWT